MARVKRQPSKATKKTRKSTQAANDASNSHKKVKADKKKGKPEGGGKKRCAP